MSPILLELLVLILGLILLTLEAFSESKDRTSHALLGIAGLVLAFILTFFLQPHVDTGGAYVLDERALFFKRFVLLTTIGVLIISIDYAGTLRRWVPAAAPGAGVGEYFAIPVLTCAGMMWMASAVDFTLIFVSLELVTISFYVLVAYTRRNVISLEAGVKYLILGALSTGFFVYGVTWIYGVSGNTHLATIAKMLPNISATNQPGLLFGVMLVLVGLGFKVAAVPFQFWVPDVYQGAPTPTTAFLSVGSKAAGFVVLLRVVETFGSYQPIANKLTLVLVVMAAATLIYGNLVALPQTNFKRLLAYSSIGHAGYLLIAVVGLATSGAGMALMIYLVAYLLMTLLSFLVLVIVANHSAGDDIAHFNGLSKRSPFLAFSMLVAMMSLAGVPLTAGFLGKFLIFKVAFESHQFFLLALGVITVGCGFYYYLKIVKAMYWQTVPEENLATISVGRLSSVTIALLVVLIFVLGIFPQFLVNVT
jgi:NADH-quinone oxidoreductase subunit N